MKKRNNTLKIIGILLLIFALGGAAIFTAMRLNTQTPVSPATPASEPKATVSCTGSGGACTAGTTCGTKRLITGTDCTSGYVCCTSGTAYEWSSSEACMVTDVAIKDRAACDNTKIPTATKTSLVTGESTTITLTAKSNANYFILTAFDPSTDKVICSGTTAASTTCPNGGSALTFVATDQTTMRLAGTITIPYSSLFVTDKTTGKTYDKVTLKAYFADEYRVSIADTKCKLDISKGTLTADITAEKMAFEDVSENTAGNYTFGDPIYYVSKNQQFVYGILVANDGEGDAGGVKITDTLKGNGLDNLTVVDMDSRCSWSSTDRVMSCTIDVTAEDYEIVGFRVKANDTLVNGSEITNTIKLESSGQDAQNIDSTLIVSSYVGCNHTCVDDTECTGGLICDTTSNKCRNVSCTSSNSCVCPTATTTSAPRVTTATATPSTSATATAIPSVTVTPLPEAGVFDVPGAALFGGGVLMAVVGILLAL